MTKYQEYSIKTLLWMIVQMMAEGVVLWIAVAGTVVTMAAAGIELLRETKARRVTQ